MGRKPGSKKENTQLFQEIKGKDLEKEKVTLDLDSDKDSDGLESAHCWGM